MTGSGSTAVPAYGRDAAHYDHRTARYGRYRRRVVDLLPVSPGDAVLDVGCGTGLCLSGWSPASGPPAG